MSIGLKRDRLLRDDRGQTIASATRTLQLEAEGLSALKAALAGDLIDSFAQAIEILRSCRGRVIVTGMGKSGHVGLKVAATLSSTGSPAYFVHPSEASHGDLGMITRDDVILAFSWSGETVELGNIVSYSRRFAVPLVAVTSNPGSTLAEAADLVLALPQAKEACPHGLAPTTSTVMQLALGDCLAMALLDSKGFTARDFKMLHPGGQLGAQAEICQRPDAQERPPATRRRRPDHGRSHRRHDREGARLPRRRRRERLSQGHHHRRRSPPAHGRRPAWHGAPRRS